MRPLGPALSVCVLQCWALCSALDFTDRNYNSKEFTVRVFLPSANYSTVQRNREELREAPDANGATHTQNTDRDRAKQHDGTRTGTETDPTQT